MTNYEKIKAMSVEEMANIISDDVRCSDCMFLKECEEEKLEVGKCTERFLEWLESEAEE